MKGEINDNDLTVHVILPSKGKN